MPRRAFTKVDIDEVIAVVGDIGKIRIGFQITPIYPTRRRQLKLVISNVIHQQHTLNKKLYRTRSIPLAHTPLKDAHLFD
jgi:hypothetical protein